MAETKQQNRGEDNLSRRGFFARVAMFVGMIAAYGSGALFAFQFLIPRKKTSSFHRLLVASLEELPPNSSRVFKSVFAAPSCDGRKRQGHVSKTDMTLMCQACHSALIGRANQATALGGGS